HPLHGVAQAGLVAPFRCEVEIVIGAVEHVEPARVTGIGVEDRARVIAIEHADAGTLAAPALADAVIVIGLALGLLLRRLAHLVALIGVVAERRYPFEGAAHALPESLELLERRARDRDEGDIALRQMDREAIETVGPERAALAGRVPARVEHEMLDDQLVMAAEQIRQRLLAVRPVENILLIHPLDRKSVV